MWKANVQVLGRLIRDVSVHTFQEGGVEAAGLIKDYEMLYTQGIASRDMFNFLWQPSQVNFFIDLLKQALLLSDWAYADGQDTNYLVPSLLPPVPSYESIKGNPGSIPLCKFDFSTSYLPDGVFVRLV